MTIGIVTDSTSYLEDWFIEEHDIRVVPLTITIDGQSYREKYDLSVSECYEKMQAAKDLPSSSQPSYGTILQALEQGMAHYDQLIVVCISKELSGTYNSFQMAAKEVNEQAIRVVDSSFTCYPLAYFVKKAVELKAEGASLDHIQTTLEHLKEKTKALLSVSNLKNFAKSGRISNSSAVLGDLLKIRPLLEFVDGKLVVQDKLRTSKKVIKEYIARFDADYQQHNRLKCVVLDAHYGEGAEAQALIGKLNQNYPELKIEKGLIGPVIGVHTGPSVFAICWIVED